MVTVIGLSLFSGRRPRPAAAFDRAHDRLKAVVRLVTKSVAVQHVKDNVRAIRSTSPDARGASSVVPRNDGALEMRPFRLVGDNNSFRRGTSGSNPLCSSGESIANLTEAGFGTTAGRPGVPRASRSALTSDEAARVGGCLFAHLGKLLVMSVLAGSVQGTSA
jgi:hypothetical protein